MKTRRLDEALLLNESWIHVCVLWMSDIWMKEAIKQKEKIQFKQDPLDALVIHSANDDDE